MAATNIFVDTSAFVALNNISDSNYSQAIQILKKRKEDGFVYVTSNYVIAEALTAISQRISYKRAVNFFEQDLDGIAVNHISPELEFAAFDIFKSLKSKNVSFVDCTSFALMRLLGIDTVFGFGHQFKTQGFKLL